MSYMVVISNSLFCRRQYISAAGPFITISVTLLTTLTENPGIDSYRTLITTAPCHINFVGYSFSPTLVERSNYRLGWVEQQVGLYRAHIYPFDLKLVISSLSKHRVARILNLEPLRLVYRPHDSEAAKP